MELFHVGLNHYLGLASVLFGLGMYGIISRRNLYSVILGYQLVLGSVNIMFVSISRYTQSGPIGEAASVLLVITGAAQIISLAVILVRNYYNKTGIEEKVESN